MLKLLNSYYIKYKQCIPIILLCAIKKYAIKDIYSFKKLVLDIENVKLCVNIIKIITS